MQIVIPSKDSKKWTQINEGDFTGILNGTRNIDLSRDGIARLSDRFTYINRSDASTSTFDETMAIVFGDFVSAGTYRYWFVTSDKLYTMNPDWTNFAVDANSGSPSMSIYSDGCAFNGSLYVSTASQLCKLTAGTWTTSGVITTGYTNTTSPHPVEAIFNNKIVTGDKNKVHQVDSSGTITMNVVTLPSDHEILWIRSTADRVYMGTRHTKGLNGKVFEWDGSSSTYNFDYELDTTRILSGLVYKGTLYCMTLDGRIVRFNGNGFSDEAKFPFYTAGENVYPEGSPIQMMTQRGMIATDDEILIAVNPQLLNKDSISGERQYYPNALAGIWAYNPKTGFYNKHGFTIETSGDYASSYNVKARALFRVPEDITVTSTTTTYHTLICTGYITNSSGTNYHFAAGLKRGVQNRGALWTQRIDSNAADELWQSIGVKLQNVYSSEDKILVKYKIRERDGLPINTGVVTGTNATWTSTTTFTSSDAKFANVIEGDEITLLDKANAGSSAHISSISSNAGVYTITLDEAIGAASGTFSLLVEPWIKLGTIDSSDQNRGYKIFAIPKKNISRAISVKCELRGEDVAVEEIVVSSEVNVNFI